MLFVSMLAVAAASPTASAAVKIFHPPYSEQKVVYEFFLDDPRKMGAALSWIRALFNPLLDEPYNQAPEFMDVIVVIHGTEIVTTVKHNYVKYKNSVERMKYYASLGVKFHVCTMAAADYGYKPDDFQDFISLVPSAMTELAHWQQQGYSLIVPKVLEKTFTIDEIR